MPRSYSGAVTTPEIAIPHQLLPRDGRFGSGPSKVRPAQVNTVAALGASLLGTSHRQAPVRDVVRRVREGVAGLLELPAGYEVALGNGGSTAFWDMATFSLVSHRASHAVFGEFGGKFARATSRAPFLADSLVTHAEPGSVALPAQADDVDVYAWPHNETSTGALAPVQRIGTAPESLVVVDGTSAAGAVPFDVAATDAYYFAPQKVFGADGGLWLAVLSPAAVERAERLARERWIPEFLDLSVAITNSRLEQTLNTPALATLVLLAEQVEWLDRHGGVAWAAQRAKESSEHLYAWAEERPWASPFVQEVAHRSPVVVTIDLDETLDAKVVVDVLRANGVLDVFPYRKLGRNQLRVATFPSIEPEDVAALTACVDHVVERLLG